MDALRAPLVEVRRLYAARAPGDEANEDFGVRQRFAELLADPAVAAQVPVLTDETADLLPNQSLVRFRGLVADQLNPEFFASEFQRADGSWATVKYADQLDEEVPQQGASEPRLSERRPLLLVPVPAESSWVAEPRAAAARASLAAAAGAGGAGAGGAAKRGREEEPQAGQANGAPAAGGEDRDGMSISLMVSDATGQTTADDGDSAAAAGRARLAGPSGGAGAGQGEASSAGGPVGADLPAGVCMAYLYDDAEVKLNEVVEVVGVLSRVPELAAAHMQQQAGDGQGASMLLDDLLSSHLPTSKAPRLHVILISKEGDAAPAPSVPAAGVAEARARTLGFLSMVLGGDDLAAEYLLLQLLGRVHHRSAESAVGCLSLNLMLESNSPAAASAAAAGAAAGASAPAAASQAGLSPLGAALAAALSALAPRCLALPLSVAGLNARPWWPRRDQGSQRLIGGPLQLATNTQVLLDETAMAAGTINEVGLRNMAALLTLATRQKVAYDFEFFSLDQPADAPVTVLSHGRSLLRDGLAAALPLRPTAPLADAEAVRSAAAGAELAPLRAYLAAARCADFSIGPDMEAFLQQELAAARQKDREVNEQTFHTWMNLARLLALSHGERELTKERWAGMRALEAARQARCPPPPPPAARQA